LREMMIGWLQQGSVLCCGGNAQLYLSTDGHAMSALGQGGISTPPCAMPAVSQADTSRLRGRMSRSQTHITKNQGKIQEFCKTFAR
jgi:hypothetical protein